jgi:hypothetical protein
VTISGSERPLSPNGRRGHGTDVTVDHLAVDGEGTEEAPLDPVPAERASRD